MFRFLAFVLVGLPSFAVEPDDKRYTKKEFQTEEGFALVEDAKDFMAPVGIAFFPKSIHQGDPKDPIYAVTELRGKLKIVRRDGSIDTLLSESEIYFPEKELPDIGGENGLTGVCITPDGKRLYTTAAVGSGVSLVNSISAWEPKDPQWKTAEKKIYLKDPFVGEFVRGAHQIGHCKIGSDGKFWVGVGDGQAPVVARDRNRIPGKILRLNLDLTPAKDNPFYQASNPKAKSNYVYAVGLRNPFSLAEAFGKFFAADNGVEVDRFIEIQKGRDYLWDGQDITMMFNNIMTFAQNVGPSGVVFVPKGHPLKELEEHFVVAAAHKASLLAFHYIDGFGISKKPKWILKRVSDIKRQDFAGLALGPDGIYITHIRMHVKEGLIPAPILKLVPSETAPVEMEISGERLVQERGCRGCHIVGGVGSTIGPNLDQIVLRVSEKLKDTAYLDRIRTGQSAASETMTSKTLLAKLSELSEEDATRAWIRHKIKNPTFDNPASAMPSLDLSDPEIAKITDFLFNLSSNTAAPQSEYSQRWIWLLRVNSLLQNTAALALFALALGFALGWSGRRVFRVFSRKKT